MAHLRRAFSRLAWNSANVRAIVSLPDNLAQASKRAPPPPARLPAFFDPNRFSPTAFEPRRSLVPQGTIAALSPHRPSCPACDKYLQGHDGPSHWPDRPRVRLEIPFRQPPRVRRKVPAGRDECALRRSRLIRRPREHSLEARAISTPRAAR